MKRVWTFKKGEEIEILTDVLWEMNELLEDEDGYFKENFKLTYIIEKLK